MNPDALFAIFGYQRMKTLNKYIVTITREIIQEAEIEVWAETPEDARGEAQNDLEGIEPTDLDWTDVERTEPKIEGVMNG